MFTSLKVPYWFARGGVLFIAGTSGVWMAYGFWGFSLICMVLAAILFDRVKEGS